jgi:hypothetical protein
MLSGALGVVLTATLAVFGRSDLIVPALAFFLAWQAQEGFRRALFISLRHAAAIAGDVVTYGGNALIVMGLVHVGSLSITGVLYGMAASAAAGALLHARRLVLAVPNCLQLRWILSDYWSIGGPSSIGNGFLWTAPQTLLPWALAALSGPAAVAGFQAGSNIVNLCNPLFIGLGNIVPQAAVRARPEGNAHVWRTVRGYMLIATPPIAFYSIAVLVVPDDVLRLFYGAASNYVHLVTVVRLLILTCVIGFAADTVILFLLGTMSMRRAAAINLAGAATSAVLALLLISFMGLPGGVGALLFANLVRLALGRIALARSLA